MKILLMTMVLTVMMILVTIMMLMMMMQSLNLMELQSEGRLANWWKTVLFLVIAIIIVMTLG